MGALADSPERGMLRRSANSHNAAEVDVHSLGLVNGHTFFPLRDKPSLFMSNSSESKGRIVRTVKDGKPILWTYVPEMPDDDEKISCPWLTVLSWQYDGSENNGMPNEETNREMLKLDLALETLEISKSCSEAYRRIGFDLREFVFYVSNRDDFLASLNRALANHSVYPIGIKFYEDANWSELQTLIDDFSQAESSLPQASAIETKR
jgi:hypothetical protein